jgi:hypothetical protein
MATINQEYILTWSSCKDFDVIIWLTISKLTYIKLKIEFLTWKALLIWLMSMKFETCFTFAYL